MWRLKNYRSRAVSRWVPAESWLDEEVTQGQQKEGAGRLLSRATCPVPRSCGSSLGHPPGMLSFLPSPWEGWGWGREGIG